MPPVKSDDRDSLVYTYTQTLDPDKYHYPVNHQLLWLLFHLQPILACICKDVFISVELTQMGNVHLHGILYPKSFKDFCLNKHKFKSLGFHEIKIMKDHQNWMTYCTKDIQFMTDFCLTYKNKYIKPQYNLKEIIDIGNVFDEFGTSNNIDDLIINLMEYEAKFVGGLQVS